MPRFAGLAMISSRMGFSVATPGTADGRGEAHKFGMFMLKAVLDGRAGQLIDLAKANLTR